MTHRLSLILPIGKYSFFAHACLKNIAETYGGKSDLSDLDVVVLLNKSNLNESLYNNLLDLQKIFKFRIVRAESNSNLHLCLLDWAFRNVKLNDWVIIQHCDFFWVESNWLNRITDLLEDDYLAIRHNCGYTNFVYEGKDLELLHDYFCVYNKNKLVQYDFKFVWGEIKNLELSEIPLEKMQAKQILFKRLDRSKVGERYLQNFDWLDGSELITIECAVHGIKIKTINLDFYHIWEFFRITDSLFRFKNKTLYVDESLKFLMRDEHRLSQHIQCSLICSRFIDKNEIKVFFPWVILRKIIERYHRNSSFYIKKFEIKSEILERYRYTNAVYGEEMLNIEKIIFKDKTIFINFLFNGIKLL